MRITLLNTYDLRGGASVACVRLANALAAAGQRAKVLVLFKEGNDPLVHAVDRNPVQRLVDKAAYVAEKIELRMQDSHRGWNFGYSHARAGVPVWLQPEVAEAEVLHLHWINSGMMSLNGLAHLARLNKPVVWTLHDEWVYTGGCHYADGCTRYTGQCGSCPQLRGQPENDLSRKVWLHKQQLWPQLNACYVVPSSWLARQAASSSLLAGADIRVIPNCVNTSIFKPVDESEARLRFGLAAEGPVLLFLANDLQDDRKGYRHLLDAWPAIAERIPGIQLLAVGKPSGWTEGMPGITETGRLATPNDLNLAYNAASVYVMPSLQDNLPNTIMESFAAGTPVAAYRTGGIPEMVQAGVNGWFAEDRKPDALAQLLTELLAQPGAVGHSAEGARQTAIARYTPSAMAAAHLQLYSELLQKNSKPS